MKHITIRFGLEQVTREVPDSTTVGQIINDGEVKMALGYGDNVSMAIDGIEIPALAVPLDNSTVSVTNAVNTKAAAPLR